uniref:hypothetical protein n=1 Tax=Runella limosa TaxID=370978 RepID=UPI0012F87DAB
MIGRFTRVYMYIWYILSIIILFHINPTSGHTKTILKKGKGKENVRVGRNKATAPFNVPTLDRPILAILPTLPKRNTPYVLDPIRFTLKANKDTVEVGEEIELTITAELLDIPPSAFFIFEEQKGFSLKLLLPDNFVQTGGNYYEYIEKKLNLDERQATFLLKGYFNSVEQKASIILLRGGINGIKSVFEKKGELQFNLKEGCPLNKDIDIIKAIYSIDSSQILISTKPNNEYLFSSDGEKFYSETSLKNSKKSDFILIKSTKYPNCIYKKNISNNPSTSARKEAIVSDPCNISLTTDLYELCDGYGSATSSKDITNQSQNLRVGSINNYTATLSASNCYTTVWYKNGNVVLTDGGTALFNQPGTYTVYCQTTCGDWKWSNNSITLTYNPCCNQSYEGDWREIALTKCEGNDLVHYERDYNPCSPTYTTHR